ncbi:MAG: PspA/IM30 family protein [Elusimicrobia bacterium]|nr:PspA/IM30 family protein [Elusimicrobiota bacterium]
MIQKTLSVTLIASILLASPGPLATRAYAQVVGRGVAVPISPMTAGLGAAGSASVGAPSLSSPRVGFTPSLSPMLPSAMPSMTVSPAAAAAPRAAAAALPMASAVPLARPAPAAASQSVTVPGASARAAAVPAAARGLAQTVQSIAKPGASASQTGVALDTLFIGRGRSFNSGNGVTVPGAPAAARLSGLSRSADKDGALVTEVGVGVAVVGAAVAAGAAFSPSFRNLLARGWNAFLGLFGRGVKTLETPQNMAQRIVDQLNAAKPEYNRKVQQASTLTEKLRLQIAAEKGKVAELQKGIDAILTDSDPKNDDMALGMINTRKAVEGSIAASAVQLELAEKTLIDIKADRARFFAEREETLAKVQAGLTRAEQAKVQKEMAELRGGFQVSDLQDNIGRFEDAVRDQEAGAKGTKDAADTNPDEVLRKAKDEFRNREAREELERRKKELAGKATGTADADGAKVDFSGILSKEHQSFIRWTGQVTHIAINLGAAVYAGLFTGALAGVAGMVALLPGAGILGMILLGGIAEKGFGTSGKVSQGAILFGGLLGLIAAGAAGYLVGYHGASWGAALGLLAASGVTMFLEDWFSFIREGGSAPKAAEPAADAAAKDGGSVESVGLFAALAGAAVAAGAYFSPAFRSLLARGWNAFLGLFGRGVKSLETPQTMAQRIVDQLNAAKPEYNRKVQQASTLTEKLRLQAKSNTDKIAELQKSIDAILTDSDPKNDDMALGLIATRKALESSLSSTAEQVLLAEKTLVDIKADRARFFAEREETLAKVQAGLTRAEQAKVQKEMAELRGGFQVGDLKDNLDRFDDAVRGEEAEAAGTKDAADTNPDEVLRKAKDEFRNREAREELERRKKELAGKAS